MIDNILATLTYYDIFDFPLKADEVLAYLVKLEKPLDQKEISLENIKKALDQLVLDGRVGREESFYFIDDKNYLVPLRIKRQKISAKKWVKAKKAIRWLRFIPYVEAVFASGSLALSNCDELSDLDVLIVVKHGRIWLARLLITGMLSLIRSRRRYFDKVAPDKICPNHYITDKSLRIPFGSIYNAQNYVNLKPILVRNPKTVEDFFNQNSWIGNYIYYSKPKYSNSVIHPNAIGNFSSLLLNNKFGDCLESLARRYQISRITRNPLTKSIVGHVVFNDNQLAFHPDSPEATIMEKYISKLKLLRSLTLF